MFCFSSFGAEIPRPEYPRPQFERESWINLNGTWSYEFDFSESGLERSLFNSKGFEKPITVPFCPESPLSGVNHKDFINAMWYHRTLSIPQDWEGKHSWRMRRRRGRWAGSVSSGSRSISCRAAVWASSSSRMSQLRSAIFMAGRPCCRCPKKSPGPRSCKSASAI